MHKGARALRHGPPFFHFAPTARAMGAGLPAPPARKRLQCPKDTRNAARRTQRRIPPGRALRTSRQEVRRARGPSECIPNPATCAADSAALRQQGYLTPAAARRGGGHPPRAVGRPRHPPPHPRGGGVAVCVTRSRPAVARTERRETAFRVPERTYETDLPRLPHRNRMESICPPLQTEATGRHNPQHDTPIHPLLLQKIERNSIKNEHGHHTLFSFSLPL